MVKSLNIVTMGVHAAKVRNAMHYAKQDKVQRLSPVRGCQKQQQEYGAIHKGVGENPLNGKGVPQYYSCTGWRNSLNIV